jgi:pimeloyl-ACP methyl ester carboxylesterase
VLEAVHASAPRPALVVLAGFAGPLLLPSLAHHADEIAGVVLLGGPVSRRRARASSFAEWYARHAPLLRDLEPEDQCALLVHRLGRSRAQPLPDPVRRTVTCSPTLDLAPLDQVLHGELPAGESGAPELPVLVVVGGDDRTLETDGVGGELTAAYPDVRTVALPNVGHLPALETPDLVCSIVAGFAAEPVDRWPLRRS